MRLIEARRQRQPHSVGVAPCDGHPDCQRLIERAEQALRDLQPGAPDGVALAPRSE